MAYSVRYLFYTLLAVFLGFISSCKSTKEIKIDCCGIAQHIPIFKTDTNFAPRAYHILINKKFIKPIRQSNSQFEIRYTVLHGQQSDTRVVRCLQNAISVIDYTTKNIAKDDSFRNKMTDYIDIGMDDNNLVLTTMLKKADLTSHYKNYDWNNFFKLLIQNHLFDIPGDDEYIHEVQQKRPGAYPTGEFVSFIEIKLGNKYRNLTYHGSYNTSQIPDVALVSYKISIDKFINDLFRK